jgi:hypothetical protein
MILRPVRPASPTGPPIGLDRLLRVDPVRVLGGDQQLLDPHRPAVGVAHRDLGLAIGAEVVEGAGPAHRGEPLRQPVGELDRHRHQRLGLVGRVAEHHPLVAGSGLQQFVVGGRAGTGLVRGVDALGDVGRLLVERDEDRDVVAVVAVVAVVVADPPDRLADDLGDVEVDLARDLAGDHRHAGVDQRLAGDPALGVPRHDGVEDRVGDLVADLVGVALGDGLGREQVLALGERLDLRHEGNVSGVAQRRRPEWGMKSMMRGMPSIP